MSQMTLIKENLDNWKGTLSKILLPCPPVAFYVFALAMAGKKQEAYLLNELLSTSSKIYYKNLISVYEDFTSRLTYKTHQAEMMGKKMLVAIGEEHGFARSFLLESLLLSYLKLSGFSYLMTEIISPSYYITSFAKDVLDYKLEKIDAQQLSSVSRDDEIDRNIVNATEENSVLIVGFNHLDHINQDPEINKKYEVFNVDLTLKNLRINKILDSYQDFFNDDGDIFCPKIPSDLEQFTLEQLILIYEDFLPYIYDEVSPSSYESKVYEANMDQIKQDCLAYKISIIEF